MPSGLASSIEAGVCGGLGPVAPSFAPPRGFRSAEGAVSVKVSDGPFGSAPSRLSGSAAQKAGLRYERKVLDHLVSMLPGFRRSPWFEFWQRGQRRWCQPDGLIEEPEPILFEVKIRFTPDAYFQLEKLYRPVVEQHLGRKIAASVVICRSFDPAIGFPAPVHHLSCIYPKHVLATPKGAFGVYSWRL